MPDKIHAVRGMNDVLPAQSPLWELLEDAVRDVFRQYGYRNIRTPILERTELFVRGIGEVTDIVEKEMYSFVDAMNGAKRVILAVAALLRPLMTEQRAAVPQALRPVVEQVMLERRAYRRCSAFRPQ